MNEWELQQLLKNPQLMQGLLGGTGDQAQMQLNNGGNQAVENLMTQGQQAGQEMLQNAQAGNQAAMQQAAAGNQQMQIANQQALANQQQQQAQALGTIMKFLPMGKLLGTAGDWANKILGIGGKK